MIDGQPENQRLANVATCRDSFYLFGSFFFLSAVYLFFIFAPTIYIPFAHHDDYYYWSYDNKNELGLHPQYIFFVIIGRGIFNLIHHPVATLVDTVSDLWKLRMITVALIAASMALFARWMHKLTSNKITAFLISASIFTLPASQIFVFWSSFGLFTVATLCSLTSALLMEAVNPQTLLQLKIFEVRQWYVVLLSLVLLIVSLYIYQPFSMFYLVPLFAQILFVDIAEWHQTKLKAYRNLTIFSIGCLLYFVFHRYIFLPIYFARYPKQETLYLSSKTHVFDITTALVAKIGVFYDVSVTSFNLWNVYPDGAVAFFVGMFILVGALAVGVRFFLRSREGHRIAMRSVIEKLCLLCSLAVMANIPILLAVGGHGGFRVLFAYSAIIVLALSWAVVEVTGLLAENLRPATIFFGLSVMMAGGGFLAQRNTLDTALNDYAELSFIRAKIAPHIDELTAVHIIRPLPQKSFLNLPWAGNGEFNINSSYYWQDIAWMIRSVVLESVKDKASVRVYSTDNSEKSVAAAPRNEIVVTSSLPEEPIKAPHGALIIDMNELFSPTKQIASLGCGDFIIGAQRISQQRECRAFDGSNQPDSFWEAPGPFPIILDLTYRHGSEKVFKYSLQTGPLADDATERMPLAWKLQGSNDNAKWIDVDERQDQTGWQVGKTRTYFIKHPDTFKHYRFVFTKGINPEILRIYEITMYKSERRS